MAADGCGTVCTAGGPQGGDGPGSGSLREGVGSASLPLCSRDLSRVFLTLWSIALLFCCIYLGPFRDSFIKEDSWERCL